MNQLLAMRVFVRLVESGTFARAADHLSLPRSTASKLVSDLEQHLGTKLVQRTTRNVTVTAEGIVYYEHVSKLLMELDEADDAIRGRGLRPRGRLRVDVPATVAYHLLIPALSRFSEAYPEVTVALGVSDRQVNIVGEGVDCVIRGGALGDPALVARKLLDLECATYASPAYIARHGVPESPEALQQGHVTVAYFSPNSERLLPLVFERGDERREVAASGFSTNDGEAHVEMLRAGLGVGQHFQRFAKHLVDAGELVPVLTDWTPPPFPLHVVYPPGRLRSARLSVFVNWLIDNLPHAASHEGAVHGNQGVSSLGAGADENTNQSRGKPLWGGEML